MGDMSIDGKEEIETLKVLSMPLIKKINKNNYNKNLHYTPELEPHEIRLVQIRMNRFPIMN
jgi:hypothetical protein